MDDTKKTTEEVEMPKEEEKVEEKKEKKDEKGFRYYCEAHSGTAFFSDKKTEFTSKLCESCGASLEYKEENYVAL